MYAEPVKTELFYAIRATKNGYRQSDIDSEMIGTYIRIRDMSEAEAAIELAARLEPFDMLNFAAETFVAQGQAIAATSRAVVI